MGMRLEIDMPEHHYNNIMAFDSVSLGRVPYKGIIMYAINAIKHGKVLDQEPTAKNILGVDCISRADAIRVASGYCHPSNVAKELAKLPSATQEPRKGHWITTRTFMHDGEFYCDRCQCEAPKNEKWDYCPNCGADMREVEE